MHQSSFTVCAHLDGESVETTKATFHSDPYTLPMAPFIYHLVSSEMSSGLNHYRGLDSAIEMEKAPSTKVPVPGSNVILVINGVRYVTMVLDQCPEDMTAKHRVS